MTFRFRRRLRIFPGISLNLGKTGISFSFGRPGAHVTVGPKGTRTTVGLPGSGISLTQNVPHRQPKVASPRISPADRQWMNDAITMSSELAASEDRVITELLKIPALSVADGDELRACRDLLQQQASKMAGAVYDNAEQLAAELDQLRGICDQVDVIRKRTQSVQAQKRDELKDKLRPQERRDSGQSDEKFWAQHR